MSDREIGAEDEVVVDAEEPWPRLRRAGRPAPGSRPCRRVSMAVERACLVGSSTQSNCRRTAWFWFWSSARSSPRALPRRAEYSAVNRDTRTSPRSPPRSDVLAPMRAYGSSWLGGEGTEMVRTRVTVALIVVALAGCGGDDDSDLPHVIRRARGDKPRRIGEDQRPHGGVGCRGILVGGDHYDGTARRLHRPCRRPRRRRGCAARAQ